MKIARKKLNEFFAEPGVIVKRIQDHLQASTSIVILQEDVGAVLRVPPNVLTVMKGRGSTSIAMFAVKWCLENGLDVAQFVER